ncbi:mediator complex, subunit Med31, partial [Kipferlia bialata]
LHAAEELTPKERFELELEFVQLLADPFYINHLAHHLYFDNPAFINYLKYLQYWTRPEYLRFIQYPVCLRHLKQLLDPDYIARLKQSPCVDMTHFQMMQQWKAEALPQSQSMWDMGNIEGINRVLEEHQLPPPFQSATIQLVVERDNALRKEQQDKKEAARVEWERQREKMRRD